MDLNVLDGESDMVHGNRRGGMLPWMPIADEEVARAGDVGEVTGRETRSWPCFQYEPRVSNQQPGDESNIKH